MSNIVNENPGRDDSPGNNQSTSEINDKRFFSIIDASPIPYALNDEEQNITYLNPAFIDTFGYDLKDIPVLEAWWPKAYPDEEYRRWVIKTWQEHLDEAKQTGKPFQPLELKIRCNNGMVRTVLASAASLSDSYDGIHLVILYDITQRKNTENALSDTLLMLENVINSTPDLIFVKNQDFQTILCNDAFASALGKKREQLYGHTDVENGWSPELVYGNPEKGIRGFIEDDKKALSGQEVHNPNDPANVRGEIRIFDTHKLPLRDINNEVIGVLGVARDITETKQAEENIRISEEKYRLAMEATQDGLWDWNAETGDVYYSPGWGRMLGEEKVEGVYSTWEDRIYDEDKETVKVSLQEHLLGKTKVWQEEHRLRKSDGSWIWVLGRGQVVKRDERGRPLRMIGTMTDISKQKDHEELIWQQANYDALTGLPNRKLFHELLDKETKRAQRDKTQLWIMFLDLDGFKEINDTFGHHKGDQLLVMVAERINALFREADIVARLGGDEFVITLSNIDDVGSVDRIASHLIDEIDKSYILDNHEINVTASIGIANFPNDANNVDDLLKFADQSMYAAKRAGKNHYTYFTPELQYGSLIRIQMTAEIRKAIENNEFLLYYQPIVNLADGSISKAEALIRWIHPEKGFTSPAAFIPIAEETGVICEIGSWVFKQAFKQLKQWQTFLSDNFQLSINMSPLQLKARDEKFHSWINELNNPPLSGQNIVIEITEGILIKDEPLVNKKLLNFRDAGIQVAIDDFGTGYSSLSYLKEFDIDYLKIDQSFVRNLKPGSREESLSEAIVVMAHKLDLKVIAEGIETKEQCDLLKSIGCDYGQGYYFSRPLPVNEFEQLFQDQK